MIEKLLSFVQARKILGISPDTLRRWNKKGKIKAIRTPTNRRAFPESEVLRLLKSYPKQKVVVIYARVSAYDQRNDLSRQIKHIKEKIKGKGFKKVIVISDIASGLSEKRRGVNKLLDLVFEGKITHIAISYKDRLTRFGIGFWERLLEERKIELMVLDGKEEEKSLQEELVEDMISIMTFFSGKLYGLRSHKNRVKREER